MAKQLTYRNFDLLIDRAGQSYQARVVESPAGQAATLFALPASIRDQRDQLALVGGAIRHFLVGGQKPTQIAKPLDPEQFGRELYEAVFAGDVGARLQSSLAMIGNDDTGLRIRLRLTYAPELAVLPWEYLYFPTGARYFALSERTPLVRYLEIGQGTTPLAVQPPLHLLVMVSDPVDVQPRLNVEAEWGRLEKALADLQQRNLITIERTPATLGDLQRRLRRGEYHLFHFIGHGWYDKQNGDAGLVLEDEQRRGRQVAAQNLGILLHDHRSLRLAFLNACEGARADEGEPFAGVAQHLVQQGLPAAIAMQFPISDRAAISLAEEFYQALADGYAVDTALGAARKAIFVNGSSMEWGTPALFTRADDNRLFVTPEQAAAQARPTHSTTINTGGGTYIAGDVNTGGGDFVGRDKFAVGDVNTSGGSAAEVRYREPIRLDVVHPESVIVGHPFDVALAIRQIDVAPLVLDANLKTTSAEGEIYRSAVSDLIKYRVEVIAPDCKVEPEHITFLLKAGTNSPVRYLIVTALRVGQVRMLFNAYQEDDYLAASNRIVLQAELEARPHLSDKSDKQVAMRPMSQPVTSWQNQLNNYRDSLRLVEERMAEFVLATDVPLQLVREKERLLARIAELEAKLSGG
jgi:hypothetical protein